MKTIIGAFDTTVQAENAARALGDAGVSRDDISVIANNEAGNYAPITETTDDGMSVTGHAVGHDAKVGAEWGAGIGFLVGLTGFAIPGLGWIAAAGWFAGTILGAGTGAIIGGLVGALTHIGVPHEEAVHYTEAVRRGSVLLAVRAEDAAAQRVADVLNSAGAINIDERGAQYRQEGWLPAHAETYTGSVPGIQTGGRAIDGTPDTRGILEKTADTLTGDRIDDKTGKPVAKNPVVDASPTDHIPGNRVPGIQTGGRDADGSPDTRGITEKVADAVTGDRIDDKTGKPV